MRVWSQRPVNTRFTVVMNSRAPSVMRKRKKSSFKFIFQMRRWNITASLLAEREQFTFIFHSVLNAKIHNWVRRFFGWKWPQEMLLEHRAYHLMQKNWRFLRNWEFWNRKVRSVSTRIHSPFSKWKCSYFLPFCKVEDVFSALHCILYYVLYVCTISSLGIADTKCEVMYRYCKSGFTWSDNLI